MNTPTNKLKKPVVFINNLEHSFGEGDLCRQILFDIKLTLQSGEVVIMKGPSGSGKTTLLTLIGALRSAQSGSLKVLNQELVGANKSDLVKIRRNIGYIFQAHNLLAQSFLYHVQPLLPNYQYLLN